MLPNRKRDPERDELVAQMKSANDRLEAIALEESELALAVTRGNESARTAMNSLDVEAAGRRRDAEKFRLAIEAFERSRREYEEARLAERAAARRAKLKADIDAMAAEQRPLIEATIERFRQTGDARNAELWQNELDTLHSRLEQQFGCERWRL